jgi:hypothetical protein
MPADNIPSLPDFLSKASTHGDIGAALVGFAAGVIIDGCFHSPAGIPPSTGGVIGLSTFLGVKQSVQAIIDPIRVKRKERKRLEKLYAEVKRQQDEPRTITPTQTIDYLYGLWKRGAITNEEFNDKLSSALAPSAFPPNLGTRMIKDDLP